MIKVIHKQIKIKEEYRMIIISDIHGHLDRFKKLLEKVNYQPNIDYLVILGDFVEKGDQVLETIHFIKKLSLYKHVYILAGNCEWALCAMLEIEELANHIDDYLTRVDANGLIRDAYKKYHLNDGTYNSLAKQKMIRDLYKEELKFLSTLPVSLNVNQQFLCVHAGVASTNYKKDSLSSLLETQYFLHQQNPLGIPIIVGHLPTGNYRNTIDNSVLFDYKKKMIAIDGGTGVKPISRLNALIIESINHRLSFMQSYQDEYIETIAIKDYKSDFKENIKIAYPDFEIKVIEKGEAFSLCQRVNDQTLIHIKNEFIYQKNSKTYCLDDYTSNHLSVSKNERIQIIGVYSDYIYGIVNDVVGWLPTKVTQYYKEDK